MFFTVFFFFMIVLPYLALPAPPPDAPGRADASCAARWMAWRILRYVPQRHRLPYMAESMSLSVGWGLDARSADADII